MSRTTRKNTKGRRSRAYCRCDRCVNGRLHKHRRAKPAPDKELTHTYETTYGPLSYNDHGTEDEDIKRFLKKDDDEMNYKHYGEFDTYLKGLKVNCLEDAAKKHDREYHEAIAKRNEKRKMEPLSFRKKTSLLKRIINYIKSIWTT